MGFTAMPPTDPMFCRIIRLHLFSKLLVLVLVATTLAWFGWTRGRYQPLSFRVTGPSMAPTLQGEHYVGTCLKCGRPDIAIDASSEQTLPETIPCFLCGAQLAVNSNEIHLGDTVAVQPWALGKSIANGQLVAIEPSHGLPLRVKRVVAVGGQTIDHEAGRLTVDGQRIEDVLFTTDRTAVPRMIIADEAKTPVARQSRWSPYAPEVSAWRHKDGVWFLTPSDAGPAGKSVHSDWLVYHHVNVHQHSIVGPVLDDYEYNAALMRQLHEVDRLQVTADIQSHSPMRIDVAYWLPNGIVVDQLDLMKQRSDEAASSKLTPETTVPFSFWSSTRTAQDTTQSVPVDRATVPVTRESPIAIRCDGPSNFGTGDQVEPLIKNLRVWKSVTYRLRRLDDRTKYPMTLRQDEYFVLGDNVPVSIDSRNHGPIRRDQIAGVVRR